jgi:hypothetical protein
MELSQDPAWLVDLRAEVNMTADGVRAHGMATTYSGRFRWDRGKNRERLWKQQHLTVLDFNEETLG